MAAKKRTLWWILITVVLLAGMIYFLASKKHSKAILLKKKSSVLQMYIQCDSLLPYLKQHQFCTQLAVLIDFNLDLHTKRMYVVNPSTKQILHTFIVSHGKGNNSTSQSVNTSNTVGSLCTSLGKYQIAERYKGQWGFSYRLDGLEPSNSNARKRAVVLHYYEYQTPHETTGTHYLSAGCPMMAKSDWFKLDKLLTAQTSKVVLYAYK